MPFNSGHVSMMVHRFGCTLLLDEFDLYTHLLRKQQDNFSWLADFCNNIVTSKTENSLEVQIILHNLNLRISLVTLYIGVSDDHEGVKYPLLFPYRRNIFIRRIEVVPIYKPETCFLSSYVIGRVIHISSIS